MHESFYTQNEVVQKANLLKEMNLYPFFRPIEDSSASSVHVDGKEMLMIGSNNYLGLTHHPYVIEKATEAIKKLGTGCTGSRFLNGNLSIHEELEDKLAIFIGHEKALTFSTGMQANLGAIPALASKKDCILSDSENHASIIDATRLSRATTYKFRHNDMESLEKLLSKYSTQYEKTIIIADGVFSMTGDIINLPEVHRLAKQYGAIIYVDDAHGLGVLGDQGRGTIDHFDLTNEVDVNMGTFSKSFASIGGFISGKKEMIDYVKHTARSFIFSASMPPAAVATVSACIDLVTDDDSILKNLWDNVAFMRKGLKEIGVFTYDSQTPVIPIFIGDDLKAIQITNFLYEHNIFATPVFEPAVPQGESLIRTSYMSCHKKSDLARALEVIKKAKELFQIPSTHN